VPVDAHAPHVIGDAAGERFDASCVFTPLPECLPSHWRHLPSCSQTWSIFRRSVRGSPPENATNAMNLEHDPIPKERIMF